MSANLVSDQQINVIVSWSVQHKAGFSHDGGDYTYITSDNAREIALALRNENMRSLAARYGEYEAPALNFKLLRVSVDPLAILKLLQGYEYQACETDDYHRTFAFDVVRGIKDKAIQALPGYDDAPWSI